MWNSNDANNLKEKLFHWHVPPLKPWTQLCYILGKQVRNQSLKAPVWGRLSRWASYSQISVCVWGQITAELFPLTKTRSAQKRPYLALSCVHVNVCIQPGQLLCPKSLFHTSDCHVITVSFQLFWCVVTDISKASCGWEWTLIALSCVTRLIFEIFWASSRSPKDDF